MKKVLVIIGGLSCAILAIWAYQVSGKTRAAIGQLKQINNEISVEQERIEMLRAEWAILNRPDRLRYLVGKNAARLGLAQISTSNYGEATQVPYAIGDLHQNEDFIDPSDIETILQDLLNTEEVQAH